MANPQRGEVAVPTGEQTFILRFDYNTVCDLEGTIGGSFLGLVDRMAKDPNSTDFRTIRSIVQAGLAGGGDQLDERAVGNLIQDVGINPMMLKVADAIKLSWPTAEDNGAEAAQAGNGKAGATSSTGRRSGKPGAGPADRSASSGH